MKTIHIIPNAHLDPVWLWDWREGYNETIATAQTIVELMRRYPMLTFVRGEANFYEPILRYRPDLFAAIRELVAAGRWDLVGGNYVQTDHNMPSTATFIQQYRRGKSFFREHFGVDVDVAWAADCAGHSAGLPEIFRSAGLRYFAFGRPSKAELMLQNPVFRWRGAGGAEILCANAEYGYQTERGNTVAMLEWLMRDQEKLPQSHLLMPLGLGNHGGGPSARQIDDVLEFAAKHPDWKIEFSTLSRFFRALAAEREMLTEVTGELNYVLRGIYCANAPIKHAFRDLEATIKRTTQSCAVIRRAFGEPPEDFAAEWDTVLFHTFHDILPGDSIERVNREQLRWMGMARHTAETKEYDALTRLAAALDMPVAPPTTFDAPTAVPFLVFNPRPVPFSGYVELESSLDYRPFFEHCGHPEAVHSEVRDETGCRLPFQEIDTEHMFLKQLPWRKRMLFALEIPPFGYRRVTAGIATEPPLPATPSPVAVTSGDTITNGILRCRIADDRIAVEHDGRPVGAVTGLELVVYRDRFGCWGSMDEKPEAWHCPEKLETWRLRTVKVLESGPERAMLFASFAGGRSQLDLRLSLVRGEAVLAIEGVLLWQERDCRLRLGFDPVDAVTYQAPGGIVTRRNHGDVPGGRWLQTAQWGFASDHFSGFTALSDGFHVNIVRGSIACTDEVDAGANHPERPGLDAGRHDFRCCLTPFPELAPELAARLETPPVTLQSWAHAGVAAVPTEFAVTPPEVTLLDLTTEEGVLVATVQNGSARPVDAQIGGVAVRLAPWRIERIGIPQKA